MDAAPTAASRLFKKSRKPMKQQLRFKLIHRYLALFMSLFFLAPQLALASTYGSGAYGSNTYGQPSFFSKYGWIIYLGLILLSLSLLFIYLVWRRDKNEDGANDQAPKRPKAQP